MQISCYRRTVVPARNHRIRNVNVLARVDVDTVRVGGAQGIVHSSANDLDVFAKDGMDRPFGGICPHDTKNGEPADIQGLHQLWAIIRQIFARIPPNGSRPVNGTSPSESDIDVIYCPYKWMRSVAATIGRVRGHHGPHLWVHGGQRE